MKEEFVAVLRRTHLSDSHGLTCKTLIFLLYLNNKHRKVRYEGE